MTLELFKRFEPEADELLQHISNHIDAGMLEEIAAADYGWKADECLIALRQIRDRAVFTLPRCLSRSEKFWSLFGGQGRIFRNGSQEARENAGIGCAHLHALLS
jgi:hypothetical protein